MRALFWAAATAVAALAVAEYALFWAAFSNLFTWLPL